MNYEWVKATEELEPVRMRLSVEPKKKWYERENSSDCKDKNPLSYARSSAKGADCNGESLWRSDQANNPCTTYAVTGLVSF